MKVERFFPDNIKAALKYDPPGSWMPELPAECIRLSSGYPDPELVPTEQIKAAVASLINEEQDLPLHYLGSPKMMTLRRQLLNRMAERGMEVKEEELLVTSGACQAIDLIARILLEENTVVVVESPTYMEALEIFRNYTNEIISIPVDEHGLRTDVLEEVLAARKQKGLTLPRLLYTIPTFQNPTGTTMSVERREQLISLSEKYDFLILEDDAYGELAFDKSPLPLKGIDTAGRVLYVGSLSKVVAPGMRVGWVAGDEQLVSACAWFKKDLEHPFAEATMASYLESIHLDKRALELKEVYQTKCDTLIRSLEQFFPDSVTWYMPEGGYFVWVDIPGVDTSELLKPALAAGVSFIPGKYFFLHQNEGRQFLRLSFSYAAKTEIVKGIQILGQLITNMAKDAKQTID